MYNVINGTIINVFMNIIVFEVFIVSIFSSTFFILEIKNKTPQKKITITGGEPLEQKEALVKLLNKLDGFDIGLYTSYSIDSIDESILKKLRFIKTGKFEVSKKINHSFYGSSNQNLYFLK